MACRAEARPRGLAKGASAAGPNRGPFFWRAGGRAPLLFSLSTRMADGPLTRPSRIRPRRRFAVVVDWASAADGWLVASTGTRATDRKKKKGSSGAAGARLVLPRGAGQRLSLRGQVSPSPRYGVRGTLDGAARVGCLGPRGNCRGQRTRLAAAGISGNTSIPVRACPGSYQPFSPLTTTAARPRRLLSRGLPPPSEAPSHPQSWSVQPFPMDDAPWRWGPVERSRRHDAPTARLQSFYTPPSLGRGPVGRLVPSPPPEIA